MKRFILVAVLILGLGQSAWAEQVKIATYNIEHWAERFDSRQMRAWARKQPASEELKALVDDHVRENDKGNWAAATVIRAMDPDIMVFQEGCNQEDLNYFGSRWLQDTYATLKVFPSNTGARDQHIGLIAKPGFKVLKVMDQYYLEKDSQPKPFVTAERNGEETMSENRLFARGPAFVLMQTPGGKQFWLGVNHQKSKSGNNLDVTKWRNREAKRTHEIMKELEKTGPADVVFGGDLNDELGMQEFEQEAGGDSIALLQGPPQNGVVLATKKLADGNAISFGGYFNNRYRSFIDHFFVTASLKDKIVDVKVINDGVAPVASDHYPVLLTLNF
ncbi:MAG TPA: hypothetical protein VF595_07970 [Tepidisphaeraceae bacterium]|jgi:hypothetical protein